jgi:hypothetical protein
MPAKPWRIDVPSHLYERMPAWDLPAEVRSQLFPYLRRELASDPVNNLIRVEDFGEPRNVFAFGIPVDDSEPEGAH